MPAARSLRERTFEKLVQSDTGCLLWTARLDKDGYGRVRSGRRNVFVHRLMFEMFVGPIPQGLEIDHLCQVRNCAAPAHLEAVSHRENSLRSQSLFAVNARKTHCPAGHPYDEANTYVLPARPCRQCRKCNAAAVKRYRRRVRSDAS